MADLCNGLQPRRPFPPQRNSRISRWCRSANNPAWALVSPSKINAYIIRLSFRNFATRLNVHVPYNYIETNEMMGFDGFWRLCCRVIKKSCDTDSKLCSVCLSSNEPVVEKSVLTNRAVIWFLTNMAHVKIPTSIWFTSFGIYIFYT